jgi:MYXO-CTERM domain-containing protein
MPHAERATAGAGVAPLVAAALLMILVRRRRADPTRVFS